MHRFKLISTSALLMAALLAGCGHEAEIPEEQTTGPDPELPEPTTSLIPTVHVASATGWPEGGKPVAAKGFGVGAFAANLDHPRWIYVLPNGDVLVAETNAPEKPDDNGGIRGWFVNLFMGDAGAATKSADRITLLRDTDGDGAADMRGTFIDRLHSPFGMALVGSDFYVANTDAVMRYPYKEGEKQIDAPGEKIADLPAGTINHHWTKNLIASPDGRFLYATVGSNSNVAENGLDTEKDRAAILEIDRTSHKTRLFAGGLRNPNGMAWDNETGALWTVVNERDELGSDLVPDYLTSVKDGGFYGWPFSYYGQHVDTRVSPENPDLVAKAIKPDYALGNHVAPLGLAFGEGDLFLLAYRSGAFIGQHGSWNRLPRSGYNVVFVPFKSGKPDGKPVDILTGFVSDREEAYGRPVGVAFDRQGALLVADDVGNIIWRVTPAK